MIPLIAMSGAAALLLLAVGLWLVASRSETQAHARDALANIDTAGIETAAWQRTRRLKQVALGCLVVSVFTGLCLWALFGGAITDALAGN